MQPDPCCDPRFHLTTLYGEPLGSELYAWLQERLERFNPPEPPRPLDQRDSVLITYGDQFRSPGEAPLATLDRFASQHLQGLVSGIHILPFYPYSSDDGFSVIAYRQVNPEWGAWEDVRRLGEKFSLMFDAVINHISAGSEWFQGFLQNDERYQDYFIALDPDTDLSQTVRPRTTPLLTRFDTPDGPRWVWTTFSADQVDLNYQNPEVLKEVIDVLLTYVEQGARFIRLDAIAFLWKKPGTTSLHLPETHLVIRFFRALLDQAAPYVDLITETNVPHVDNISYFGNGENEAQMVYNFALPPLVLHTFATGDVSALRTWAASLSLPSTRVTFFNFLASHDGVGLNPARGILSEEEIERIVGRVQSHGGLVSSKTNPDGSQSPYELNISYFDALSNPAGGEPQELQVRRFLAAHAILLSMVGLPGIYVHSLLGTRNWTEGVQETGRSRTINRRKFRMEEVEQALADEDSLPAQVFSGFERLLQARGASPAFHPYGSQLVLDAGKAVFGLIRISPDGRSSVVCLVNAGAEPQQAILDLERLGLPAGQWQDLVSSARVKVGQDGCVDLDAYQVLWLKQP
jgi:sucrose phosphorylase